MERGPRSQVVLCTRISSVRTPDQRYPRTPHGHCFVQLTEYYLEHNISGDVLCMLDPESLKAVGVATIGQRLTILKAIYQAKLAYHIPIDSDHYVPPCASTVPNACVLSSLFLAAEAQERFVSVEKLNDLVQEQGQCLSSALPFTALIVSSSSACLPSRTRQ